MNRKYIYNYRPSIEELYDLTSSGKSLVKLQNLDEFRHQAFRYGDNDIGGKIFGENFYDFLIIDNANFFKIDFVKPATEDQDIKEGKDVFFKFPGKKQLGPANYKFSRDKNIQLKNESLDGLKNILNREDKYKINDISLVASCTKDKLPFQIKNFGWNKITVEDYEPLVNNVFFKRFADWIQAGKKQWEDKRRKALKNIKTRKPYIHQVEMRKDNHKRVLTNMVFQGAGKTDDQYESILAGYTTPGSNAYHIFPYLALADQNSFEVLLSLKKRFGDNLKILNHSSTHDWRIESQAGFPVEHISFTKDLDKWKKYMNDPNLFTYTIGTYAGLRNYVNNIVSNDVRADFYFDEAACLVPGQQIRTIEDLEDTSSLEQEWFGPYSGKGPYDLQYGIDNNIIADPQIILVEYDEKEIRKEFPEFKEDDPNMIDAYCLGKFNRFVEDIYGYFKTIGYLQSAKNCDPLVDILKKHYPKDLYGAIVGATKQIDRQRLFKAFAKSGISGSLLNYMCLILGISENSANGVYMSRNMNDRLLSHAGNRQTRRHPDDKPYQPLKNKPVGYLAFGVDKNNPVSLIQSTLFRQQIYKLFGMGINPKITIIDSQSRAKDDDSWKKHDFNQGEPLTLTGNEKLKIEVEELLNTVRIDIKKRSSKKITNALKGSENFDSRMKILEKAW